MEDSQHIMENISNPKRMMLDILIEDPTILLKPNPSSNEYLEINLGHITIKNERKSNNSRVYNII